MLEIDHSRDTDGIEIEREQVERKINYRFVVVIVVGKGKNVAKGKEKSP